ncbi:transglycosylase SLT domain-containing protein [Streptomyces daliensis]|uniref:Transglycosylase SLT domain-containing protein n=1 Tax=Streptomyces daliensis TaxID=299421 RepID=A0A8T4IY31_9ACTN|nr:transglycosylase SLT domain-containing protein [Streptomyces daliensis]
MSFRTIAPAATATATTTDAATATATATAAPARNARIRRFSVAGLVTTGAAAVALTLAPSPAHAQDQGTMSASAATTSAASVSAQAASVGKGSSSGNLDGWIHEALDIMKAKGIPGSYEGLHRNIMRESGGDPNAQNGWDVNAQAGTPSKGLLQVIQPTFDAYHVDGTANSLTDPVANITAAANYAADKYGSIDNVDSAY